MRPTPPTKVSNALARTASAGGNRLVNMTTSGTQVPAATPVIARATTRSCVPAAVVSIHAPRAANASPMNTNGLRRPSQSASMPSGKRTIACHRPYMESTMPTDDKVSTLLST